MSEKRCPNCGGTNSTSAKFCSFCGIEMIIAPVNPPQYANYGQPEPTQQDYYQQNNYQQPQYQAAPQNQPNYVQGYGQNNPPIERKDRIAAAIFAIILGDLGIHKFYLGNIGMGILYLCLFWTGIPALIGLIEGIIYLTETDEEFYQKHVVPAANHY